MYNEEDRDLRILKVTQQYIQHNNEQITAIYTMRKENLIMEIFHLIYIGSCQMESPAHHDNRDRTRIWSRIFVFIPTLSSQWKW